MNPETLSAFISWSGPQSKRIAAALTDCLKKIFSPSLDIFMSAIDMPPGADWGNLLSEKLAASRIGILCVTKENMASPWLLFEAGALMKRPKLAFICPYLYGIRPEDILASPLHRFQALHADKKDTFKLACTINDRLQDKHPPDRINILFSACWKQHLARLLEDKHEPPPLVDRLARTTELMETMATTLGGGLLALSKLTCEIREMEVCTRKPRGHSAVAIARKLPQGNAKMPVLPQTKAHKATSSPHRSSRPAP